MTADQIKLSYVFNFAKFVEWPNGMNLVNGKITLCVIGSNVLGGALSTLDGRKAGDHELHVVQHINPDDGLNSCHIVFIGESEQRRFVSIIKALGDSPVLTISDIEDFAEKGGDIGLLYHENKIIFEVNLTSVQRTKLRLPAQLLNIASYVFGR
jgi:hypothetical protein